MSTNNIPEMEFTIDSSLDPNSPVKAEAVETNRDDSAPAEIVITSDEANMIRVTEADINNPTIRITKDDIDNPLIKITPEDIPDSSPIVIKPEDLS